jgi:hypothetical protein
MLPVRTPSSASVAPSHAAAAAASSSSSSASSSSTDWDNLWPIDQILLLADAEVIPTMVSSWFKRGAYKEIIDSWSSSELKKVFIKVGLPPLKGSGATAKMRASLKAAIVKQAVEDGAMDTAESEEDEGGAAAPPSGKGEGRATRAKSKTGAPSSLPLQPVLDALSELPTAPKKSPREVAATPTGSKRKSKEAKPVELDSDSDPSGHGVSSSGSDSDDADFPAFLRSSRATTAASDDHLEANGLARPFAKQFIRNVLSQAGASGSVYKVFKYDIEFKRDRNKKECITLARMLDSLLRKRYREVTEQLCRRLAGVHAADTSDNWAICDAFELVMDKQSFVPDDIMQRAIKNVMRMQALESASKSAGAGRASGTSHQKAGGGKGGKPKQSQRKPDGGAAGPNGAPSASRKKTDAGMGGSPS